MKPPLFAAQLAAGPPLAATFSMDKDMTATAEIRELNDKFRTTLIGGRVMMTRGIVVRDDANDILRRVQQFDQFGPDNDPHGEHDFGAFEAGQDTIFWKMDYYNCDFSAGSPDPADPSVTTRVLTIMRADEW